MKHARDQLNILNAYEELGSYRAAAALCGTTHKTVKRVVQRRRAPVPAERPPRPRSTDPLATLIAERVRATDGRISAKRLLPVCRASGYVGSARTLRRAVAEAKAAWRRDRRVYRPWVPVPGEHLVIDWGSEAGLHVFCAVLPWSRVRFVRFAADETQATTLRLLAECFEVLGGVPGVVLADRMGCLKGGVVANVVVPASGYVRFAAHHGFRPDFCEAADPESKGGVVEHLVGYAKADLVVPGAPWPSLEAANAAAIAWCAEVNGRVHTEIAVDAWSDTGRALATTAMTTTLQPARQAIVDVRQASEYRGGHIPSALPFELGRLGGPAIADLPPEAVFMCGHGERAMTAASLAERSGRRASVFIGGADDWARQTGQPLARD